MKTILMVLTISVTTFYINQSTNSQKENQRITNDATDDYRIYEKKIREAWAFHKPNYDYENTLRTYQSAFKSVSAPFAIDVMDALKIAIEVDSIQEMFEFSTILVEKGCKEVFFEKNNLAYLQNFPKEWKKLQERIEYVQSHPNEFWNVELKEKMESLYRKDQELAHKYSGKTDLPGWCYEMEYFDEVKMPFLNLVKEYGLLSEKELGIYIEFEEDQKMNNGFPYVIMLHIYQSGESRFSKEELEQFYIDGHLYSNFEKTSLVQYNWFTNRRYYPETNAMIQRNAPEDSIRLKSIEEAIRMWEKL